MNEQGIWTYRMNDDIPVLDAKAVSKSLGAVLALRDASLRVNKGEIVALMGANGAGKSTFVKILTGALQPDSGHVRIKGRDSRVGSPAEARQSGLVPVYQEPSLIPDLDVADSLRLGNTPAEAFRHWVAELGFPDLRMDDMIGQLPLATLRILDLARALASEPDVLLLEEMTAALPTNLSSVCCARCGNWPMRAARSSRSRTASPRLPPCATAPPCCAMGLRSAACPSRQGSRNGLSR